jgi:hypothetical protein
MYGLRRLCGLAAVFSTAIDLFYRLINYTSAILARYEQDHSPADNCITVNVYSWNVFKR